jgi:FkbM family methyltransferase
VTKADLTIGNLRQRIATKTPGFVRKAVRMALNYPYRLTVWLDLLREVDPADARSRAILWLSAFAAPATVLRDLDSYRAPRLLGDVTLSVHGVGSFSIRAGTDDVLHVMTSREPHLRSLLETELSSGGTFVDGGANIGFYSMLAARQVGVTGRVLAFEMMPDTAEILRRHVAANGTDCVTVLERALSDRSGDMVMATVEPGLHGQASIVADEKGGRNQIGVATTTLDESTAELDRIDLMKLDLEGAEYLALRGATATLARTACLVFESNNRDERIFAVLDAARFSVERLDAFDYVARPITNVLKKVAK